MQAMACGNAGRFHAGRGDCGGRGSGGYRASCRAPVRRGTERRTRATCVTTSRCASALGAHALAAGDARLRDWRNARPDGGHLRSGLAESTEVCGIAGFFGTRTIAPASIERMLAALRPRGPDAESVVLFNASLKRTDAPAPNGLLSTRLSIIDPRPEANQPMANAAGDVWIAYNGEVYDWAADAKTLDCRPASIFRTHSDTEFILHAYEHWGLALHRAAARHVCDSHLGSAPAYRLRCSRSFRL